MTFRIHIQGNCQSQALAIILKECGVDASITWTEVYKPIDAAGQQTLRAILSAADLVLIQPTLNPGLPPELRSTDAMEMVKPGAVVLRFPVIYYRGQHPTLFNLQRDGVSFKTPGITYADVLIAELILAGLNDDAILAKLIDPELFDPAIVRRISNTALDVLAERERRAECEILVTPSMRQLSCERQLMNTFNHPVRETLAQVAQAAMALAGISKIVPEQGEDSLRYPHFPVLPAVAAALGMRPTPVEDLKIEFQSRVMTLPQYIDYNRRCYSAIDPTALAEALVQTPEVAAARAGWSWGASQTFGSEAESSIIPKVH